MHISYVREEEEQPSTLPESSLQLGELARMAPILAGKLARLAPEQLAIIFPPENSVGPM
ncbi:hypothetical protein [Paenarthrobacter sp. NPDC057981]|uniref:hypothetical protein n=1 Tax=Paenarthrobacter sp. NPDC057981 TaxID=3346297 RepID=UPI0036DA5900